MQPASQYDVQHTPTVNCPVCVTSAVSVLIEIEQVPVHCNVLWPTASDARNAPKGDIRLGFCQNCGHLFNLAFNPTLMEYTQTYENSLHFSPEFQRYAESLADRLIGTYDLHGKDIIEIGCGKGDFLRLMCTRGANRGVGFDPSFEPDSAADDGLFQVVLDFYSEKYADYQADFICCRHVLEHVEFPRDFMASVRRSIGNRQTVVYFEVPNVAYTLRDMGIWDLIYEHYSYFSLHSLARLFVDSGFQILHIEETYGGQFLGIEAIPATQSLASRWSADLAELHEQTAIFSARYEEKVNFWRRELENMVFEQQRVVIWGGGSKGVTFLNTLNAQDSIHYVVDINPRKSGKFVGGTGQQLVLPALLRDYDPQTVLIMNPLYRDEITAMLKGLGLSPRLLLV